MSSLADYTCPGLLIPRLQSRCAAQVIRELCAVLEIEGRLAEPTPFYQAVIKREELSSTATASGWALPHSRMPGILKLSFALGFAAEPLNWYANASPRVHTVFLFAVPENEISGYLSLISGLARLSRDPDLMNRLRHCTSQESMFEALRLIQLIKPQAATVKNLS